LEYLYYIVENVTTSDPTDQGPDTRIIKIPIDLMVCKLREGDGPYQSIRKLKRYSRIFDSCKRKGSKYLQKLLDERNIVNIKDFILIEEGKTYSKDFITLWAHAIGGQIKNRKVYGFHYYEPDKIKIIKELKNETEYGVWSAQIAVFDKNKKQWIQKGRETTFFPKGWTLGQLFHECDYSFQNISKDENRDYVYISKTLSGVPVEIIIKNSIVKTIYPVIK